MRSDILFNHGEIVEIQDAINMYAKWEKYEEYLKTKKRKMGHYLEDKGFVK